MSSRPFAYKIQQNKVWDGLTCRKVQSIIDYWFIRQSNFSFNFPNYIPANEVGLMNVINYVPAIGYVSCGPVVHTNRQYY